MFYLDSDQIYHMEHDSGKWELPRICDTDKSLEIKTSKLEFNSKIMLLKSKL